MDKTKEIFGLLSPNFPLGLCSKNKYYKNTVYLYHIENIEL